MPDGAHLGVTVERVGDRTGKVYSGTIQPDVPIELGAAEQAAQAWLEQRCE